MECFSRLKDNIFEFNVIAQSNVKKLRNNLGSVADALVARGLPAPYQLMLRYNEDLLLPKEHVSAVQDKELWVAYFEFVIICALIDDVDTVDDEYLQALERKRRIVYSSTGKNWLCKLDDILKIAKRMLDRGGTIVVNSPQENADMQPTLEHLKGIIDDITAVPPSGSFLQIDNANEDTYKTFTVTHLKGLRDYYVVKKEWEFGKATPADQLQIFRSNYSEVIK